jgi:hypothetical protein
MFVILVHISIAEGYIQQRIRMKKSSFEYSSSTWKVIRPAHTHTHTHTHIHM